MVVLCFCVAQREGYEYDTIRNIRLHLPGTHGTVVFMPSHDEYLAEAMQNYALAHHHLSKLKDVLDLMISSTGGVVSSPSRVGCVREWQDWLAVNGPALKADVYQGTGIKFSERGGKYTVDWRPILADAPADRFPSNTLMKINAKPPAGQRGAPPKIYFLWSSRFDVLPKFGVGPERPPDHIDAAIVDILSKPVSESEQDTNPVRFDTMEAWDQANVTFFDFLVRTETKPTDEQKQELYATLPDGADRNAALAIAYRQAVERARAALSQEDIDMKFGPTGPSDALGEPQTDTQPVSEQSETLLGVVMPPEPVDLDEHLARYESGESLGPEHTLRP